MKTFKPIHWLMGIGLLTTFSILAYTQLPPWNQSDTQRIENWRLIRDYAGVEMDTIKKSMTINEALEECERNPLNSIIDCAEAAELTKADGIAINVEYTPPAKVEAKGNNALRDFLISKDSPMANVDIVKHCDNAGITRDECRLLVAMTGKESNWARTYRSTKHGYSYDLGVTYHNPSGVKGCKHSEKCPAPTPIPDTEGMWLQKYPSFDNFWETYTVQMKVGYFDKGCSTVQCLVRPYVGRHSQSWVKTVSTFYNQVPDLN